MKMKRITKLILTLILIPLLTTINIPLANASGWVNTNNPNIEIVEMGEASSLYLFEDNFIPSQSIVDITRPTSNSNNPRVTPPPSEPPEDPENPPPIGDIPPEESAPVGIDMTRGGNEIEIETQPIEETGDDIDDDIESSYLVGEPRKVSDNDAATAPAFHISYEESEPTVMYMEIEEPLLNLSLVKLRNELDIEIPAADKIKNLGEGSPNNNSEAKLLADPQLNIGLEITQPKPALNVENEEKNSDSKEFVIEKTLSQLESKEPLSSKIQPEPITKLDTQRITAVDTKDKSINKQQNLEKTLPAERSQARNMQSVEKIERVERPQVERVQIERPQLERQVRERPDRPAPQERIERQEPRAIERAERPQIERIQPERPQIERPQAGIAQPERIERPDLEETRRRDLLRR